jgi:protein TonB
MNLTDFFFSGIRDLDEVVFEHRNKLYGAYELRTHYNHRLRAALIITLMIISLFALLSLVHREKPELTAMPPESRMISPPDIIFPPKEKMQAPLNPKSSQKGPVAVVNDSMKIRHRLVDTTSFSGSGDSSYAARNSGDAGLGKPDTASSGSASGIDHRTTEINQFAEVMPSFPGGAKAFSKYFAKKFRCETFERIGGSIVLKFVVMADGSINQISVLRETVSLDCVEQAKQIIAGGPKWNPGMQNNRAVNVMVVQPITLAVQ